MAESQPDAFDEDAAEFGDPMADAESGQAPLAHRGRGRGRGKGREKAPGRGGTGGTSGSGGRGGKRKRESDDPCLCCSEKRYNGNRFCAHHQRLYGSLEYRSQNTGDAEDHETFKKEMQDDARAQHRVSEWEQANPGDKKFARKAIIDFATWRRSAGLRTTFTDRSRCKPYTQASFEIWATGKQGLSKAETESHWKAFYNNRMIERDRGGLGGREQLYIPRNELLLDKSRFMERATDETSKAIKNPKEKDINSLHEFTKRQKMDFSDPFFGRDKGGSSASSAQAQAPNWSPNDEEEKEVAGQHIDVTREAITLSGTMVKDIKKIKTEVGKTETRTSKAVQAIKEIVSEQLKKDRLLRKYIDNFSFRWFIFERFQDDGKYVEDLIVGWPPVASNGAPGTPPTSTSPAKGKHAMQPFCYTRLSEKDTVAALEERKNNLPFAGDIETFKNLTRMEEMKEGAMDIEEMDEFKTVKAAWVACNSQALQLLTSLTAAANDVTNHIANKKRENIRATRTAATEKQAEELKKVKEEAKVAADAVRAKTVTRVEVKARPPVYSVEVPTDIAPMLVSIEGDDSAPKSWDEPFVRMSSDKLALLVASGPFSKALTSFAGQYKKTDDAAAHGRSQYPLQVKYGKEETDKFFETVRPSNFADISPVTGGTCFMNQAWLFGYTEELRNTTIAPSGASMFRVLLAGEVQVLLIEIASLQLAVEKEKNLFEKCASVATVCNAIEEWTAESFQKAKEHGVKINQCKLTSNQILFIPMGWVSIEQVVGNQLLHYGIRKSYITTSATSVNSFKQIIEMYKKGNRQTSRMAEIHTIIEAAAKAAVPSS